MSAQLTETQKRIVENLKGNLSVCAGAGTGKTRVLVERYLKIIRDGLAEPREILAITFTDKAANEMKRRIVGKLQSAQLHHARRQIENAYIGTIHSFCSRLLKEHPMEAGVDPNFRVLKEIETNMIKQQIAGELIESRFSEGAVSEFLLAYSEKTVSGSLLAVYNRIRSFGLSAAEMVSPPMPTSPESVFQALKSSLTELRSFSSKAKAAEALLEFLEVQTEWHWAALEKLQMLGSALTLRAKEGKEETKAVKEWLDTWAAVCLEDIGRTFKEIFLSLLTDFEKRYEAHKRERAYYDFADLPLMAFKLLSQTTPASEAVRIHYQKQFKFIMVDEFQDTDRLQVALLNLLTSQGNLLIVGDTKQSIYGFRGAEPRLFDEKEKEFLHDKTGTQEALLDNFRSRPQLIDFFNQFFSRYLANDKPPYLPLRAGPDAPQDADLPVDFIDIEQAENETSDESRTGEARALSARIQTLTAQGYAYKDFAVLFRAGTKIHLYEHELRQAHIPYHVLGGRGFYAQHEIKDAIHFLTILDNPYRDIPFAAVLRSPMVGVTDDTLFWLSRAAKHESPENSIFHGFLNWRDQKEITEADRKKLEQFEALFDALRNTKDNTGVSVLLTRLIHQTQYDLYCLSLPQGKRHYANLQKLIDMARELEMREPLHLSDFTQLIKHLTYQEARETEAQTEAEEGNVVKLMTIHQAKGLEFKICILPDLARRRDQNSHAFLYDDEYGLTYQVPNPQLGELEKTYGFQKAQVKLEQAEEAEFRRLLYVAMTRASEKLVLIGTGLPQKTKSGKQTWYDAIQSILADQTLPVQRLSSMPEVTPVRAHQQAIADMKRIHDHIRRGEEIPVKKISPATFKILQQIETVPLRHFDRIDLPVSAYLAFAQDKVHQAYRRQYEIGMAAQTEGKPSEQALETEETTSPTDFGTMTHRVFEGLILRAARKPVAADVVRFYFPKIHQDDFDRLIRLSDTFLRSPVYRNLVHAKVIHPEIPFVLRLQKGIIHGVLDLLYQDVQNRWVIVDYKTSSISAQEVPAKANQYKIQMELYALACYEMIGVLPAEALLYFPVPDQTFAFTFEKNDAPALQNRYAKLQADIIAYRKQLLSEASNVFV